MNRTIKVVAACSVVTLIVMAGRRLLNQHRSLQRLTQQSEEIKRLTEEAEARLAGLEPHIELLWDDVKPQRDGYLLHFKVPEGQARLELGVPDGDEQGITTFMKQLERQFRSYVHFAALQPVTARVRAIARETGNVALIEELIRNEEAGRKLGEGLRTFHFDLNDIARKFAAP